MADVILDTTGLNCPLPILKTKKKLRELPVGGILEILATDPGAVDDFGAFCSVAGHELLQSSVEKGVYKFVIKREK